jgi:hypothetical protein
MPGTVNGVPVPAWMLQPPGAFPGVPPLPKADPPTSVNGG